MRKRKTISKTIDELLAKNPEQIALYIDVAFASYTEHRDIDALLAALRRAAQANGVTKTAADAGITRHGLQNALREGGNPRLRTFDAILRAMGSELAHRTLEDAHV